MVAPDVIGLVTSRLAEPLDGDLPLLADAFAHLGRPAVVVAWDDPDVEWSALDLAVVRSTWDYVERFDEFLAWLATVERNVRVVNDAAVIRWNTDKHYLAELAAAGIPVVPTTYVPPGHAPNGIDPVAEYVVKPTIGAGSRLAERLRGDRVGDHVAVVHREGLTAMVQPYVDRVDAHGETSLVYVGDGRTLEYSHAFNKGAILSGPVEVEGGFIAVERIEPSEATDAERALGEAVVVSAPIERFGALAYARIDLVPGDGGPLVLEVELTEPSLYFHTSPGSAERAARCWGRWLAPPSGDEPPPR